MAGGRRREREGGEVEEGGRRGRGGREGGREGRREGGREGGKEGREATIWEEM